jgi:hypothetical protein
MLHERAPLHPVHTVCHVDVSKILSIMIAGLPIFGLCRLLNTTQIGQFGCMSYFIAIAQGTEPQTAPALTYHRLIILIRSTLKTFGVQQSCNGRSDTCPLIVAPVHASEFRRLPLN